ncbi:O-antigen ligase family protein [Aurantiacibacter spongiae]|uniref:O-antigen ligase domain-containing protein n=1 Tax=Aurantiacibacter spongiae TaxID=2488860 RepID=A0A3N5CSG9_9SPHN|nr:O-antigen ligase family protein [Aurantiacibacter spongiae]RPF71537.1 O-antigen ligase domain-containing protein [Aurantiacibacter spongiae]
MATAPPVPPPKPVRRQLLRSPVAHLQILVVLAVLVGGGGVAYGLRNLAVQLFALLVLALNGRRTIEFVQRGPRVLVALVLATLALPLLQLVPLPPAVWRSLPQRDLAGESLAIAGYDAGIWYPFSLDRARTLVAFCGTLAPATVIAVGTTLGQQGRIRLVRTLIVAALGAFALGTIQILSANTAAFPFINPPRPDILYATFANRNSTGLFFVITLVALIAVPWPKGRGWLAAAWTAGALLTLGTILTQSRSSIVLLLVPIAFVVLRVAFARFSASRANRVSFSPRIVVKTGLAALAAVIAVVAVAPDGGRVASSFARFETIETDRLGMWDDGTYVAGQYWPAGSGMGTFDEVFQVYESLEYVSPRRAGRAHNDYIEMAIEGGLTALLLAFAWLAWSGFAALRRRSGGEDWLCLGGGLAIACVAAQSLVDYPLRNQSLLCVVALMVILMAPRRDLEP